MSVDVASLSIIAYPDPVLRAHAAPVSEVTDEVRAVAERMIELMREAEGIGLAAPQVGLKWRLFVAEVPLAEGLAADADPAVWTDGPRVYINPQLADPEGVPEPYDEGCLSLPEISGKVRRPPTITVLATGLDGRRFTVRGTGLLARCWQHEVDHLDGVLILDRMDQMSRLKCRTAVRDLERREGGSDAKRSSRMWRA